MYRAITSKPKQLYSPHSTPRLPGNVPYLVDNLWEWARPEGYPSRRRSAYASPRPKLALAAVPGGRVYRVFLKEGVVAQIRKTDNCLKPEDAKYHPDVKNLIKFVTGILGADWFVRPLIERGTEASLWAPCLSQEDMDQVIDESILDQYKAELRERVTFWEDVALGNCTDEDGEIFFEYPGGYVLEELESDWGLQ